MHPRLCFASRAEPTSKLELPTRMSNEGSHADRTVRFEHEGDEWGELDAERLAQLV
jgi:hypothetical protein